MLDTKPLNRIIFLDIETTSQYEHFKDLTDRKKEIFKKRFKKDIATEIALKASATSTKKATDKIKDAVLEEMYDTKGPIYPEFGRILCISMGVIWEVGDIYNIKITSFYDKDEKKLLESMVNHPTLGPILNSIPGKYEKNLDRFWALNAFNGVVFDYAFIAKRLIINGIKLPQIFDYSHLKPWELEFALLDPKKTWSHGVNDSIVSLECLADLFGIESSKDDIDGSEVKNVYYKEGDLERIKTYCEKDVKCLAEIFLKMKTIDKKIEIYNG